MLVSITLAAVAQLSPPQELQPESLRATSLQTADLSGNGPLDVLAFVNRSPVEPFEIGLWLADATGSFGRRSNLAPPAGESIWAYRTGDVDGDGDVDVVGNLRRSTPQTHRNYLAVWRNQGGGQFAAPAPLFDPVGLPPVYAFDFQIGDLNGDGVDDLVLGMVPASGLRSLMWIPGPIGAAPFAQSLLSPAEVGRALRIADLDGDGDADLAYSNGSAIGWARNDGAGSFSSVISGAATSCADPDSLFVSDANGDGRPDILFGEQILDVDWTDPLHPLFTQRTIVSVLWNGGSGPALPCDDIRTQSGSFLFRPVDFDNDGDGDLLTVGMGPTDPLEHCLRVEVASGGGLYQPPVEVQREGVSITDVIGTDLDGDGVTEVLYSLSSGTILIASGAASPAVALEIQGDVTAVVGDLAVPHIADLDGDGAPEIAAMSPFAGRICSFRGDGQDSFEAGHRWGEVPAHHPSGATWADFDDDGDMDYVFTARDTAEIAALENLGPAGSVLRPLVPSPIAAPSQVLLADLDGDGMNDIVAHDFSNDRLTWYRRLGTGAYAFAATLSTDDNVRAIALEDVDGDGDIDLLLDGQAMVAPPAVTSRTTLHRNDGTGLFAAPETIAQHPVETFKSHGLFVRDLDGDGAVDIVRNGAGTWTGQINYKTEVLRGLGGGTFTPPSLLLDNAAKVTLAEDVDGDGRVDLMSVYVNQLTDAAVVYLHRGRGDATFQPAARVVVSLDEPVNIALGDVDSDGDLDLATTGIRSGRVEWYETLARGEIGQAYCVATANSSGAIGLLQASGSALISDGDVTLMASQLPQHAIGMFVTGTSPLSAPIQNSLGTLCVGGQIGRFALPGKIQSSGATGAMSLDVDLGALPSGAGFTGAAPGEYRYFQLWHRDVVSGAATSNLTQAVRVLSL